MRHRLAAVLLLVVSLPSCRTWLPIPGGGPAHESLDAVLWMRTSAEYYALTEQAYRLAMVQVEQALKPENAAWTAATEQVRGYQGLPPAVIVDVDEAVLDTGSFQARLAKTGEPFDSDAWDDWVREQKATAIPGAVEFAKYADAKGVRIFFVTNRDHDVEEATRQNLRAVGFPVDADGANILTKGERPEWLFDKTSRREFIAAHHRVILMIGDDLNDFVPGTETEPGARVALAQRWRSYWGTRWILIPNAFYGGWEQSLSGFEDDLTPPQVLRRKQHALEALDEPPAVATPGHPHP